MSLEFAQWAWQLFVRQWSWNLVAAGIGFYVIIMTRRILLGGAKLVLIVGTAIIAVSAVGVATPSGEIIFTLLGNLAARVGLPDGLTGMAFGVLGGVGGGVYLRAPAIEKTKK